MKIFQCYMIIPVGPYLFEKHSLVLRLLSLSQMPYFIDDESEQPLASFWTLSSGSWDDISKIYLHEKPHHHNYWSFIPSLVVVGLLSSTFHLLQLFTYRTFLYMKLKVIHTWAIFGFLSICINHLKRYFFIFSSMYWS